MSIKPRRWDEREQIRTATEKKMKHFTLNILRHNCFIYTSLFAQIAATKQIKQHTKLINNYDKSNNLLNTALRSWRTVLILSPNCMKILCNCRRAVFANSIHKLFSEAVNLFKKLAVRISIWLLAGRNPKLTWHSLTTFDEPVRKSFMKMRVNVNSNDKVWRASNGHASTAYIFYDWKQSMKLLLGKHELTSFLNMTS